MQMAADHRVKKGSSAVLVNAGGRDDYSVGLILTKGDGESPDACRSLRGLGVDDWALRNGQTDATLLGALEPNDPVEIRPDRFPETLGAWLQVHAGVEIGSRDRAGASAEGRAKGRLRRFSWRTDGSSSSI